MSLDNEFVHGVDKLQQRIRTIRERLELPAMVQATGVLLVKRTKDRFNRGIDPNYTPWKPLAPATLEIKRRLGYGQKGMLKRTENMYNAIRVIRGGLDTFSALTGAGLRIGIDDPDIAEYARFQQRGTKKIPARRFLGIGRLDIKAVDGLMRRKARQLESVI